MGIYDRQIIRLDFGEPDFKCPDEAKAEAIKYILNPECRYSPINGEVELVKIIVETSLSVYKEELISITTGGLMGINLIIRTLKKQGIKRIYYPNPGFPPYRFIGGVAEVELCPYPMNSIDDCISNLKECVKELNAKEAVFIVTSPNNPNGLVFNKNQWVELFNILSKQYIICDNSFEYFVYNDEPNPSINSKNIFQVFSFSKTYSLADYRVGYVISPNEKLKDQISREQWFLQLSTSTVSQKAAIGALKSSGKYLLELKKTVYENIMISIDFLNRNGINVERPQGGFFLWLNINMTNLSSDEFVSLAYDKYKLSLISGSKFGDLGEGFIRINCATNRLALLEGLNRLVSCINERKVLIESFI